MVILNTSVLPTSLIKFSTCLLAAVGVATESRIQNGISREVKGESIAKPGNGKKHQLDQAPGAGELVCHDQQGKPTTNGIPNRPLFVV